MTLQTKYLEAMNSSKMKRDKPGSIALHQRDSGCRKPFAVMHKASEAALPKLVVIEDGSASKEQIRAARAEANHRDSWSLEKTHASTGIHSTLTSCLLARKI